MPHSCTLPWGHLLPEPSCQVDLIQKYSFPRHPLQEQSIPPCSVGVEFVCVTCFVQWNNMEGTGCPFRAEALRGHVCFRSLSCISVIAT